MVAVEITCGPFQTILDVIIANSVVSIVLVLFLDIKLLQQHYVQLMRIELLKI